MGRNKEKRMVEGYEITNAIHIGDKEVVFGIDENASEPYFCAFYRRNAIFGNYEECLVSADYVEMVELFSNRIKEQCDKVREEWEKVTVPRETITEKMCIPITKCGDIEGKIMVIRSDSLRPEYKTADHQLVYVTGGHGAMAGSHGKACFCTNLYSGKSARWERYDLEGEIKEEYLPEWAKEKFQEIKSKEAAKQIKNKEDKAR